MDNRRRPIICCIDGNIGVGKCTILGELSSKGYIVFKEDVESWKSLLTLYYNDRKRWAFTLQTYILNSMNEQFDKIKKCSSWIVFVERSPLSNIVFSKVALNNGMMTDDEYGLLKRMVDRYGYIPDITVMIRMSIEKLHERIKKRNRLYEQNITMSYLSDIDKEYNKLSSERDFIVLNDVDADPIDIIINRIMNVKL